MCIRLQYGVTNMVLLLAVTDVFLVMGNDDK